MRLTPNPPHPPSAIPPPPRQEKSRPPNAYREVTFRLKRPQPSVIPYALRWNADYPCQCPLRIVAPRIRSGTGPFNLRIQLPRVILDAEPGLLEEGAAVSDGIEYTISGPVTGTRFVVRQGHMTSRTFGMCRSEGRQDSGP